MARVDGKSFVVGAIYSLLLTQLWSTQQLTITKEPEELYGPPIWDCFMHPNNSDDAHNSTSETLLSDSNGSNQKVNVVDDKMTQTAGQSSIASARMAISRSPTKMRYNGNVTNRWNYRLQNGGTVFFKHLRKAGGSSVFHYLADAIKYHHNETLLSQQQEEQGNGYTRLKWFLYHQEWSPMAWDCPQVDPRWNSTMSVIVLRSPIDRQLSEFFYSGPGISVEALYRLTRGVAEDPIHESNWTAQMEIYLPQWIEEGLSTENPGINFCSEYQTKMLSGLTDEQPMRMNMPYAVGCFNEDNNILNYTGKQLAEHLDDCDKTRKPCFYGGGAAGGTKPNHEVTAESLDRAKQALREFDLVLLTETLSEPDQAAMVADAVHMPESVASLKNQVNVGKYTKFGSKSRFEGYRSLLQRRAPHVYEMLEKHTYYDYQLYEYARQLNREITDQWRIEKGLLHNT